MNSYLKNLCMSALLAMPASPSPGASAAAATNVRQQKVKKAKKAKAYSPNGYLKQKAVGDAVDDTTPPGAGTAGTAPVRTVIKTVDCQPEEPPKVCEPGDASCDRVEIAPKTAEDGATPADVPGGEDLAKDLFKKVRERCRPEGQEDRRWFKPIVGLSVTAPTSADQGETETTRVFDMTRRVGGTVGFKAEF